MKRKLICLILTGTLVICSSAVALAAEEATDSTQATAKVVVPDMNFTGTQEQLTLDQAIEKMTKDSPEVRAAELNKKQSKATAESHEEAARSVKKAVEAYGGTVELSMLDRDASKLLQEFSLTQGDKNYTAEINKLRADTINNYYSVVQAGDNVSIHQDSVAVQEKLLANVEKKFELGMVAKQEVLQAQLEVTKAKNALVSAQNTLALAKMGLNNFLGYDVMQDVSLTSALKEVELPTTSLKEAIEQALANRNEIKGSNFAVSVQELQLTKLGTRYPKNAAVYMNQEVSLLKAQQTAKDAVSGIEIDVRNKYMTMNEKKNALTSGIEQRALAEEAARLTQLTYDAGMSVLTDVQNAENMLMQAKLGVSKAMLEYNLAVEEFQEAYGIGRTVVPLG